MNKRRKCKLCRWKDYAFKSKVYMQKIGSNQVKYTVLKLENNRVNHRTNKVNVTKGKE